jgi:hypothetical protein
MRDILLFDVEGTLTREGQPIDREMVNTLRNLNTYFHILSSSYTEQLIDQFFSPMYQHGYRGDFIAFPCSGAATYRCLYTDLMHIRRKEFAGEQDKTRPVRKLAEQYVRRVVFIGNISGDNNIVKLFIDKNPELNCEYHDVNDYKETIELLKDKEYVK